MSQDVGDRGSRCTCGQKSQGLVADADGWGRAAVVDGVGAAVGRVGDGAEVGRVGDGTEVGRLEVGRGLGARVVGRVLEGTGDGAAVGAPVLPGRVVDGTGRGAVVVVGGAEATVVGLATGAGRAPPSANALAAMAVPKTARPVAVTAMSRARFAGFEGIEWLQTAIMAPGVGTVAGKDARGRNRLSIIM